jgi:hypothetical protein
MESPTTCVERGCDRSILAAHAKEPIVTPTNLSIAVRVKGKKLD